MENQNVIITPDTAGPTIRTVEVNRGVEWLVGGFRMFMKNPVPWAIVGVALILAAWILGKVGPNWMGSALTTVIAIVAVGVLMRACEALENGRDMAADAQKTASLAPLWILGLIAAGLSIAVSMISLLLGVSTIGAGIMSPGYFGSLLGFGMLIWCAMSVALTMALWLAPALVVLKGVNPVQAIRYSLVASLKNLVPFIIFSLLSMVACIIAAIPIGLGLLVAFPALICASYLAYKDIFVSSGDAVGYVPPQ